jgi:hypothetical protein
MPPQQKAMAYDARKQTVGIDYKHSAGILPDPAIPVDGYTFGVATMTDNSPHAAKVISWRFRQILFLLMAGCIAWVEGLPNPNWV